MHVDLDHVDSEACSPKLFQARVCIAGGGVAGIILASSLAAKGVAVHLLEGGGLEPEESSQELYKVIMTGAPHCGATEGRFRTLGGSSTRWGGQMLPYTEDVFDPPPELGLPRWPLEPREIEPYYDEVQRIFQVSQRPFTDALLTSFHHPLPLASDEVRLRFSKWAPFARRNLAHTLGRECAASARITLCTHASDGFIPAFKLGNRWRFRRSRLGEWMDRQSGLSKQPAPKLVREKKKPVRPVRAMTRRGQAAKAS